MDNRLISIIIPAYQASETILRTLDSLYHQDYSGPKEIIVVNSSQDKTKDIIQPRFPEVDVIQLKKRVFTGEAKNIGLQRAKGEIIAFIDSDCIAVRNWLSTIINKYKQGYKIAGGSIGNANPTKIVSKAEYFLELIQLSPGSRQRQVNLISTANCFIAREIFEKHGPFPTVRKGVDMVFSRYLIEQGEKILFVPEMKVSHACTTSFWRYLKKQILHGEYSMETRKIANLPGSFLTNSWLFIPFLPFIRIFFVLKHIFSLELGLMKDFLVSLPVFLAGNLAWSYGFAKRLLN
ncbi:MAG: glycosyltransferase [Candidatus Aminicenantales bacterium]